MTILQFARTLRLVKGAKAERLIPSPREMYQEENTEVRVSEDGDTIIVFNTVSGYCSLRRIGEFGVSAVNAELTKADFRRLISPSEFDAQCGKSTLQSSRSQINWFKPI